MNYTYTILKYLYKKSGDGKFHDLGEAIPKRKKQNIDFINQRADELRRQGLIEVVSDNPPLRFLDEPMSTESPKFDRAKIKSEGEEYIDSKTIRLGNWIWRQNNFLYVSVPVIIGIITFIVNMIICD